MKRNATVAVDEIENKKKDSSACQAESELRDKNQITMPKLISDVLGAHPGDRFIWIIDEGGRGVVSLYRLPESYAGSLAGMYGGPAGVQEYLIGEREAWGE